MVTVHRVGRVFNFAKWDIALRVGNTIANLAKQKPDIWHLHTPNVTMVLALHRHLAKCRPLVVSHHSDVLKQRWLRPAYETVETRIYERASMLLSDSPDYIDGSRQLNRFRGKTEVLPIGIDVDQFQRPTHQVMEWSSTYRSQFGQPLWLAVGRLSEYKGLEIAVRALAQLPGQLAIVGEGPCRSRWQSESERQGVADRVHWLGKLSDEQLKGIYRAATALWFPSNARNEGFGIVQVEAMASGCPVINTDLQHSGVAWVSAHEVSGLTAECNDVESFVACSRRLLEEPDLRDRLSRQAQAEASNRFREDTINEQCIDLYQKVLSCRR
jgi:rhamnosyl/mannosyltransferase